MALQVLALATDIAPFTRTESAELTSSLCQALATRGADVTVVAPLRPGIDPVSHGLARRLRTVALQLPGSPTEAALFEGKLGSSNARVFLVDHAPSFQLLDDSPVTCQQAGCYEILARAAIQLAADCQLRPQIVQAHGWPTAMLPQLWRKEPPDGPLAAAKVVLSLYQVNDQSGDTELGLLRGGIAAADAVTVPGPGVADQLRCDESNGPLHSLCTDARGRIRGIVPGLDYATWSPDNNRRLAAPYAANDPKHKQLCKQALLARLGLEPAPGAPLVMFVDPAPQQPVDVTTMVTAAAQCLDLELQLGFAGSPGGESIAPLASQACAKVGQLEITSVSDLHVVLAGADAVVVSPRSEGAQASMLLKSLSYGAIPVAAGQQAAQDILVDFDPPSGTGTGIVAPAPTATALVTAIRRLVDAYRAEGRWRQLQGNAMSQRFTWDLSACRHEALFAELAAGGLG